MSAPAGAERRRELLARVLPPAEIAEFSAADGVAAAPLAAPSSVEAASEVLRLARAESWTVLPLGAGTKLAWGRPPERVELVLSSRNLRGVSAFEPADGTLTARAGTPWSELVRTTAARHHLSPELAGAATLGGVLGAGASGFDRLRYGPLRHQLLGITALHADGSLVKSGGRVVKNVTGYDLHRLWCGSRGTLCFLVEATLRLYPAPSEVALLRERTGSRDEGVARAQALLRARVLPVAVQLSAQPARGAAELAVVLAGRAEALESELAAARAALGAVETLRGDEARGARAELVARESLQAGEASLELACRPSRLAATLARLDEVARELRLAPRLRLHPLLATVSATLSAAELTPERSAALARGLAGAECTLAWRALAPLAWPALPSPAETPATALMQRLKQSIDPDGLFVRGRFHAGL